MKTVLKNLAVKKMYLWGFFIGLSFLSLHTVQAQATTVMLTVNGGGNASIINGTPVLLEWYIDGPVTSCSINNGVGAIDVSVKPAIGSIQVTPPENTSTTYTLNCNGTIDAVTVDIKPTVSVTIDGATTREASAISGNVGPVTVRWTTQFATNCTKIWRETASNPGVKIWTSNNNNPDKYRTSGALSYGYWPHGQITQTTTFFITCYNVENDSEQTASATITVTNPPPPPAPVVTMTTQNPIVVADSFYGYAFANVAFTAQNATRCDYRSLYENGIAYPNPIGFGQWSGHQQGSFSNIMLATTTIFEVKCERAAVTIGGTTYPVASDTKQIKITVDNSTLGDRSALPPVTIAIQANPTSVIKDPILGTGQVAVSFQAQNAQYCYTTAHYENGTQYSLSGWTRTASWNRVNGYDNSYTFTSVIATSTKFTVECLRQYDVQFGDATQKDLGQEIVTITVPLVTAAEPASAPVVYMYGNAVTETTSSILANATANTNFSSTLVTFATTDQRSFLRTTANSLLGGSNGSLTFPFAHPHDDKDTYNIHVSYCDENDGVSTFTLSTANSGEIASWVSDEASGSASCGYTTIRTKTAATNVALTDGELITLNCTSTGGETCLIDKIYFGAGNNSEVTSPRSVDTGLADADLLWFSENTTWCNAQNARTIGGADYQYAHNTGTLFGTSRQIATTTTFSITCGRAADSLTNTSAVTIKTPLQGEIITQAIVAAGECIDVDSGTVIKSPLGYWANPTTSLCELAFDIRPKQPALNLSSAVADANGNYSSIQALVVIENLGPGPVTTGTPITYKTTLTLDSVYNRAPLESVVGSFTNGISAPSAGVNPAPAESPTLTMNFQNVPFGRHRLCADVNLVGTGQIPEAGLGIDNNNSCVDFTLAVPKPPMTFSVNQEIVRSQQPVTLSWDVSANYPLNCILKGAGGVDETFTVPSSGSVTTSPLSSNSRFTLQCTEPTTNTSFTEELSVEVVPNFEEL